MRVFSVILTAALALCAQQPATPNKDAQTNEAKGMPPRAAASEYLSQAKAGEVTIAAEFMGHAVPTPQATLATEDYVVIEVGIFGPPEARLKVSTTDFSLRAKGKKTPLPSQPYTLVFRSIKDPEWQPPGQPEEAKSKTSFGTGGRGAESSTPAPVHVPFELQRAMQQHVQRAALPEGDRALPVAGLIFFEYRGKAENLKSIELVYEGAAGKATVALQP